MRHEVIVGVERGRVWSDDEKLSILSEVGVHGATVADVARRYDVTRQHIYQWRHQMRDKGRWPATDRAVFLALDAPVASEPALQSPPTEAEIGVVFENGRVLRWRGGTNYEEAGEREFLHHLPGHYRRSRPIHRRGRHVIDPRTPPSANLGRMHAILFDSSENAISSRIASSATLALDSGAVLSFSHSGPFRSLNIHLNSWPDFPRPPLKP